MATDSSENETSVYTFLLTQDFTLMAFSSAIEPLRMANQLSGENLYEWHIVTPDNQPVKASNNIEIIPDRNINEIGNPDTFFVCSGTNVTEAWTKPLQQILHKISRQNVNIGSLCSGTYLLSKAGLLDGYRCTTHWENLAGIREQYPSVTYTEELFELDRDRYTCAGGSAPLDMMLHLIKDKHGKKLADAISEMFICERIRDKHDRQKIPLRLQLGTSQPKLTEAIELMEANLEEPMSLNELSTLVGVSRRQLERLFQKYLQCVPTRYYLDLRLKRARQLLLQTDKSIVDVALACGFVSAPHFSKCYRDHYGFPPRDERRRQKDKTNLVNDISDAITDSITVSVTGVIADSIAETLSESCPGAKSDEFSEELTDVISQTISDSISDSVSESVSDTIVETMEDQALTTNEENS